MEYYVIWCYKSINEFCVIRSLIKANNQDDVVLQIMNEKSIQFKYSKNGISIVNISEYKIAR